MLALALVTGVASLGPIVPDFCKQWEPTGCSPAFEGALCSTTSGTGTCDAFALTPEVFTVEFFNDEITMPPGIVDVTITDEYLFPYAYTSTNGMPDFPIVIKDDLFTDAYGGGLLGFPVYTFTLEGGNLQFTDNRVGDECVITYACAE